MTESQFKTRVVSCLRREMPEAWVYHPSDKWVSGIPDLLILNKGVFCAIELKVGHNHVSKIQEVVLAKISKAGGLVHVCRGEDGLSPIKSICGAIRRISERR